ncbi:hypothetical protein E4T56_gene1164 [Termitomyces sp. T112]|nr:hypothetical protein E4T56_gene1164 [Termitomyces sp. T112]
MYSIFFQAPTTHVPSAGCQQDATGSLINHLMHLMRTTYHMWPRLHDLSSSLVAFSCLQVPIPLCLIHPSSGLAGFTVVQSLRADYFNYYSLNSHHASLRQLFPQ